VERKIESAYPAKGRGGGKLPANSPSRQGHVKGRKREREGHVAGYSSLVYPKIPKEKGPNFHSSSLTFWKPSGHEREKKRGEKGTVPLADAALLDAFFFVQKKERDEAPHRLLSRSRLSVPGMEEGKGRPKHYAASLKKEEMVPTSAYYLP